MRRSIIIWFLAFIITAGAAIYQRTTGPTYKISGSLNLGGQKLEYHLERAHEGQSDQIVAIDASNIPISGWLYYRRYEVKEEFTAVPLVLENDSLKATLPLQPEAGKLEYYVELVYDGNNYHIPADRTAVIRFKGFVPRYFLVPHIFFMFAAMLWATRTGLQALIKDGKLKKLTVTTVILLGLGGLILGPIVQKYAFGSFWTGIPFGWDLTDNKTLIAFASWIFALVRLEFNPRARWAVLAAAIILMAIYLIPHSALGSQFDYTTGQVKSG